MNPVILFKKNRHKNLIQQPIVKEVIKMYLFTKLKIVVVLMFTVVFTVSGISQELKPDNNSKGEKASEDSLVNQWRKLNSGKVTKMDSLSKKDKYGPKMLWVQHIKSGVIVTVALRVDKFSIDTGDWNVIHGTSTDNSHPDKWVSPASVCYLPNLKKILTMQQQKQYGQKFPIYGWLIDPTTNSWEQIRTPVSMSDKSADFEPGGGKDGRLMPIWGSLCYDAYNKEAVSFGGGGVWGRVDKVKSKVVPGDWIYDEAIKRCRRLTEEDKGKVNQARRWFPGHCGTWTFSEEEKMWKSIEQAMHAQPSGRILPGMVYDSKGKKIFLFGGDDLAKCNNDTWVYDCKTRSWSELKPAINPRARAGQAMVYIPEANAILMAGGYSGGWQALGDVWLYKIDKNEWICLGDYRVKGKGRSTKYTPEGLVLPFRANYCSGFWVQEMKEVVLACYSKRYRKKPVPVISMKFDINKIVEIKPTQFDPMLAYHCKAYVKQNWKSLLPDEWESGDRKPGERSKGRAELTKLPANRWVKRKPPAIVPPRGWGSFIYDIKSHKGFAWGGGHGAYPGSEISEYDVITDRWRSMAQPTNYLPKWLFGMAGGPPGLSFGGWSLLPNHARKSYGFDPISNTVITYAGDIYDPKHHSINTHIGDLPMHGRGQSYQESYVTASHGLYAFVSEHSKTPRGWLCRANVAAGKWDVVDKTGPTGHTEYDFLVFDSKRDRLIHFRRKGGVLNTFDFKSKVWAKESPVGNSPSLTLGDAAYIPEMDAVLLIFGKGDETMYFYKCKERKWYTAPYKGDKAARGNYTSKNNSPIYDPELKIIVRIYNDSRSVGVNLMRLVPASLTLTPFSPENTNLPKKDK
ncbi:MAG: hypothetical protein COA79_12815 [Planctomycetota bacterium]|nr:MAG: hypothetical protein COA79_12815 [Planctomycetota bacterium]